jgi:hypothetical protein
MIRRALLGSLLLSACFSSYEVGLDPDEALGSANGGPRSGPGGQLQALTYYRDVKPIIDEKCTQCHAPGGMARFSLTTYDEVVSLAKRIKTVVETGRMPPWRPAGPLDQFVGDRRLTPERKQLIASWVDQGAPAGSPAEAPPPVRAEKRGLPRVDSVLPIPGPYTPLVEPDNYRCFVLEWPHQQLKYITGLSIEADNKPMVHHAIVYLIEPANVPRIRQRDDADPGPGFDCYGIDPNGGKWLTSYEPGGYGQENPSGAGFAVQPGSLIVLQMHYNTLAGKGIDSSVVQLMLADKVEKVGSVSLIMNPLWAAGFMRVPPNEPDVVHRFQGRPAGLAADRAYDLHWVDLHMHTLGRSGNISLHRAGATEPEVLLDIPDWSFEWQETFRLRQPIRLNPGDQLSVECRFDNTAENQTVLNGERFPVRDVNWGENTTDEMCLGNVLATPVL